MALITFPDIIKPSKLTFGLKGAAQSFTSEFTGSAQYVRLPGVRWYGTANWENLSGDDFESLKVFLAQLEGPFNTFEYGDISKDTPSSGLGSGTILEANAATSAHTTSMVIRRATAGDAITGTVSAFKKGDYFQVTSDKGQELKVVTADVNITNTSTPTVNFAPALRGDVSAGADLTRHSQRAKMRLSSTEDNRWEIAPPVLGQFGFSFQESF